MSQTPDIASVVSMIMQNPELVAKISGMVKEQQNAEEIDQASESITEEPTAAQASAVASEKRIHRAKLANAMKPYLSKERAQAIDTMMSIADILDLTRGRS